MWQKPSDKETSCISTKTFSAPLLSYKPESGAVVLRGLSIGKDHDILFHCGFRDDVPALLFKEDFDVLSILVFLKNQKNFPSCQLIFTENNDWCKIKWSSSWLSETILGKTLYTCEQYLNLLAFNSDLISIASKEDFFDAEWYHPVINLIEDLKYVAKKSKLSSYEHIAQIKPVFFDYKTTGVIDNTVHDNNNWHIEINNLPISISIYDKINNQRIEPITPFLDFNREAFPQLMPVLERYRQLYSLFNALKILRDAGYRMPETMINNYNSIYQYYFNVEQKVGCQKVCKLLAGA